MEEIQGQLQEIRSQLKDHDHRFDRLDDKIDGLAIRFENLQSTVPFLAEQMSTFIHANTDVKQRVDALEENQQNTDIRLNVLERR